MAPDLEFFDDPGAFLSAATELLAARPVESTVMATVTERLRSERAAGLPDPTGFPLWWLLVRDDGGSVVGAAMRTPPFGNHPAYLLSMPETAARDLARVLHDRGELLAGVNGALPAAEVCAAETAALTGSTVRVAEHTRLHVLDALREPVPPAGRARHARAAEVDQVVAWYGAFGRDAAEQAGRAGAHSGPGGGRGAMVGPVGAG